MNFPLQVNLDINTPDFLSFYIITLIDDKLVLLPEGLMGSCYSLVSKMLMNIKLKGEQQNMIHLVWYKSNWVKQILVKAAKLKYYLETYWAGVMKWLFFCNLVSQDSMRGMNPSTLQSMFQANHMGKGSLYDNQGGKMKKKPSMMLHSDPSILGKWRFKTTADKAKMYLIRIMMLYEDDINPLYKS